MTVGNLRCRAKVSRHAPETVRGGVALPLCATTSQLASLTPTPPERVYGKSLVERLKVGRFRVSPEL